MHYAQSLIGQKIGKLWAIGFNAFRNDMNYVMVYCECGLYNEITVDEFLNNIHRCKCVKEDKINYNQIIGSQLGEWKIIERTENKGRTPIFSCLCSCGNRGLVSYYALVNGKSKSCGHKPILESKRKPEVKDLPEVVLVPRKASVLAPGLPDVPLVGIQAPEAAQDPARRNLDPSLAEVHIEPTEEQKRMFGLA